jgi:hypothetical protein
MAFFLLCRQQNMEQYQQHPAFGSHVDYVCSPSSSPSYLLIFLSSGPQVPTFMDYLDISPSIDARAYSNGMSLLLKKSEPDRTLNR